MSSRRTPRRRINKALDRRRREESDIEYRPYVRPDGHRNAIVETRAGGFQYPVSAHAETSRPGTVLPVGSQSGSPNRFVLGSTSPPGRRGPAPPIINSETIAVVLDPLGWVEPGGASFDTELGNQVRDIEGVGFGFGDPILINVINQSDGNDDFVVSNIVRIDGQHVNFRITWTPGDAVDADLEIVTHGQRLVLDEFVVSAVI